MEANVQVSLSRFLADLHTPREPVGLAHHLLTGLQAFIPSDYNSWKEISFSNSPRVTAVFSPHNPVAASLLPVFQRHVTHHPICSHWRTSGHHTGALSWLDVTKRADFEREALYSDFYRPLGIHHQLLVALDIRPMAMTYLALNRSRSPFTEQDRLMLTALQPHASQALRHDSELRKLRATLASFETFVDRLHQGIVCLSSNNRISWASKRARGFLQSYWGCSGQTAQLPDALLRWLLLQEQVGSSSLLTPQSLTVQHQAGRLVVRMLKEKKERYLFLEETPSRQKFTELTSLGLTEREAEVLGWIAQGKSNEETSGLLGIGPQTVKKHLERIYDVLGVANRTEAALKVHAALHQTPMA